MTFLALIAIIFFGFAVYNLTCAFVDIPVIFKALADGQGKSGDFALNQFAALFNKIKGCIVG